MHVTSVASQKSMFMLPGGVVVGFLTNRTLTLAIKPNPYYVLAVLQI